eukprot:snap_masked-scaffold_4-processed-gene-15.26-mRNA-1 protein AED:1.00 eAED:1.00 QI:0/-1/0/0/-1/1/1/0/325
MENVLLICILNILTEGVKLVLMSLVWSFASDFFILSNKNTVIGFSVACTIGQLFGSFLSLSIVKFRFSPLLFSGLLVFIFLETMNFTLMKTAKILTKQNAKIKAKKKKIRSTVDLNILSNPPKKILFYISVCLYNFLISWSVSLLFVLRVTKLENNPNLEKLSISTSANIGLYSGLLTLLSQCFILFKSDTQPKKKSKSPWLLFLPIFTVSSIFYLLIYDSDVQFVSMIEIFRRVFLYSLVKPSLEASFENISLSQSEKYKLRTFVDTFVVKFGQICGGYAVEIIKELYDSQVSSLLVVVFIFWTLSSIYLFSISSKQKEKLKQK